MNMKRIVKLAFVLGRAISVIDKIRESSGLPESSYNLKDIADTLNKTIESEGDIYTLNHVSCKELEEVVNTIGCQCENSVFTDVLP